MQIETEIVVAGTENESTVGGIIHETYSTFAAAAAATICVSICQQRRNNCEVQLATATAAETVYAFCAGECNKFNCGDIDMHWQ